jgi:hypothetical protein
MPDGTKRPQCSVEGCEWFAVARGWCNKHYLRARSSGGDPGPAGRPPNPGELICTVDDCDEPQRSLGVCQKHYVRLRKHGDVHKGRKSWRGVPCSVEGCEAQAKGLGYCRSMHYARVRKTGEPGEAGRIAPERRRKSAARRLYGGYAIVPTPDGPQMEHRVVMSRLLDRPLEAYEHVHHRNGLRDDNRPENLELWARPHPSGQRPEDLVAWVVSEYPDLVRAALGE